MKKADLERKLKKAGFVLKRNGSRHDVWGNDEINLAIPRHRDIDEMTAKAILKDAGIKK
jgi:mRNA interferase HicA